MFKRICCLLLALGMLLLCSCSLFDPQGRVRIVSGNKTYKPVTYFQYSLRAGLAADGRLRQPAEVADELDAFVLSEDYEIVIRGNRYYPPEYLLVSLPEGAYVDSGPAFVRPQDPGTYVLRILASWGNDKRNAGYQYFFKFTIPD